MLCRKAAGNRFAVPLSPQNNVLFSCCGMFLVHRDRVHRNPRVMYELLFNLTYPTDSVSSGVHRCPAAHCSPHHPLSFACVYGSVRYGQAGPVSPRPGQPRHGLRLRAGVQLAAHLRRGVAHATPESYLHVPPRWPEHNASTVPDCITLGNRATSCDEQLLGMID